MLFPDNCTTSVFQSLIQRRGSISKHSLSLLSREPGAERSNVSCGKPCGGLCVCGRQGAYPRLQMPSPRARAIHQTSTLSLGVPGPTFLCTCTSREQTGARGTSEGILICKAASQGAHVPSQSPALLCDLGTGRKSANKSQRSCHSMQTQDPGHCRDSGSFQGTLAPGSG